MKPARTASERSRFVDLLAAWAVPLAAGLLWGAALLETPLPGLRLLAPVALGWLLSGWARPFLAGWLHGLAAWCVAISWIAGTVTTYGLLPGWLGVAALLLLASYLALYHGVFAWLGARFWSHGGWRLHLGIPGLWVVLELLRGWLLTGFPWNLAAQIWIDLPAFLPAAAAIGSWGLSFVVVGSGVSLARALRERSLALGVVPVLAYSVVILAAARFGAPEVPATGGSEQARIIQPNSPALPYFDPGRIEEDFRRLLRLSSQACLPGTLLVWPESAAWPFSWQEDPELREQILLLVEKGCSVLFNSPFSTGRGVHNSALLVASENRGGEPSRYDKRHLVPFGEYVPLARILPFLPRLARAAGDFVPASEPRLLPWKEERLGVAICYEIVFPFEVADLVQEGATVLVTMTNDSWYGRTSAPWQHLQAARLRAAESRRWVLRAAITGISARIDPLGEIREILGVGQEGSLAGTFEGIQSKTFFVRAPWLIPGLAVLLALGALVPPRSKKILEQEASLPSADDSKSAQ